MRSRSVGNIAVAVTGRRLIILLVFSTISRTAFAQDLARAAIEARLDHLQNIAVSYNMRVDCNFDPKLTIPVQTFPGYQSKFTLDSSCIFNFLDGGARQETRPSQATKAYWTLQKLPVVEKYIETRSLSGRDEQLSENLHPPAPPEYVGGIAEGIDISNDWTVDLALGLRLGREQHFLKKEDIEAAHEMPSTDPNIVVLQIDGNDAVGTVHEMHFDKRLFYALVYSRDTNSSSRSYSEIVNSGFHTIDGVALPYKIVRQTHYVDRSNKPRVPFAWSVDILNYVLNDPKNVAANFLITWPADIRIFDDRIGAELRIGKTARVLSDDDIRQQIKDRREGKEVEEDINRD